MAESTPKETQEFRETLDSLKKDFGDLAKLVKGEAQHRLAQAREKIMGSSGEWAKDHPAASIGVAAGVAAGIGFVLGLLAGRGRD